MRWQDRLLGVLTLVPRIVDDVERTHQGKSGQEKQAAAMEVVKDAIGAVDSATPEHAAQINAVTEQISKMIPGVVGVLNLAGVFRKKGKPATA